MIELTIPASVGEVVDKITILQLKLKYITDPGRAALAKQELLALETCLGQKVDTDRIQDLVQQLLEVNEELWHIEDFKRECERRQSFGDKFVSAARQVYIKNDQRARIKLEINQRMGSKFTEVKSHQPY